MHLRKCVSAHAPGGVRLTSMQEIIDDVVAWNLPKMDQGSKRHTVGCLITLVALREIKATKQEVLESIERCGFVWTKVHWRKRPMFVKPSETTQST